MMGNEEAETSKVQKLRLETVRLLKNLVQDCCAETEKYVRQQSTPLVPIRDEYSFDRLVDINHPVTRKLSVVWSELAFEIIKNREELGRSVERATVALEEDVLLSKCLNKKIGVKEAGTARMFGVCELVGELAAGVLEQTNGAWNEEAFECQVRELEAFLSMESPKVTVMVPFLGLSMQERIDLDSEVTLRSLSNEEISVIWSPTDIISPYEQYNKQIPEVGFVWFLEGTRAIEEQEHGHHEWDLKLQRLEDALRLCGASMFLAPFARIDIDWWRNWSGLVIPWARQRPVHFGSFNLGGAEIAQLKDVWGLFDGVRGPQVSGVDDSLRLALKRLASASIEQESADILLDCTIGLEALYLRDVGEGELRYRFALGAAYFLGGKDPKKRREVFEQAKGVYDARSYVVHGEQKRKSSKRPDVQAGAENAIELLRESLLRLLPRRKAGKCDWPKYHDLILRG